MPHIYPEAFEDEEIEAKIQGMLEKKGVRILKNYQLFDIGKDDEDALEYVAFKNLDMPDAPDSDEEDGLEEKSNADDDLSNADGTGEIDDDADSNNEQVTKNKRPKRKRNEDEINCRVLITAGHRDVDQDVFLSIHNNGLVYNGRLIVEKSF